MKFMQFITLTVLIATASVLLERVQSKAVIREMDDTTDVTPCEAMFRPCHHSKDCNEDPCSFRLICSELNEQKICMEDFSTIPIYQWNLDNEIARPGNQTHLIYGE